jgi:glucoamylase
LKVHQSKEPPGGIVASLAVPWGETEQQTLDFRYQLCWTRDAVEAAIAFVAVGDGPSAKCCWEFLMSTQREDGHWPQNMWLDGRPHASGIQMDETALPILLADMLRRYELIDPCRAWPTVRSAAAYLVQNGPGTQQDRWEKDGGYSPYTLAVEIAALLAAAEFAELQRENGIAEYLRNVADWWNECVEEWTFLDDHYIRLAAPETNRTGEIRQMIVAKKAHSNSPAALALVRFGLRRPDDPRILKTVEVIDRELKSEPATGPVWHRYPDDRYGEYDNGEAFDGSGIGRGWPLLTGERSHYEIAGGNFDLARQLAGVMEKQTNPCGFIPEQVWDRADLPECDLFSGRPTGSAMPLVWAHAEYLKLLRSLRDGTVFDMPPQPVERYQKTCTISGYCFWRTNHKLISIPRGKTLRVESRRPAHVYWTLDDWKTVHCTSTKDSQLGVQYCDLPTTELPPEAHVGFTFWWSTHRRWENQAYVLTVK